MTGYARTQGSDDQRRWVWEARSVNGRNLEVRCRVPQGFDRLENPARTAVGARLRRGNVSLTLTIASEDLSIRSARTREYLEFQRSRGLLRFDPAQAKYFATRRFALRSVRQQLLPVAGDLRAKPLLIGLALACLVLVARALLPAGPVFFGAVVLAVVAADGFLAGWMFAPRVLPWSMILAAVPLYFAPAAANWAVPLLPPYVAFVTHMQRLKRKAVVVKIASPPKRLGNTILRWILLLALFVAFFLYFRHPAR